MTSADYSEDKGASKPEPLMYPTFTARNPLELAASVVPVLRSRNGAVSGCGTAFFVSDDGVLLTAGHVVSEDFVGESQNGVFHGIPGDVHFIAVPGGDTENELGHLVGVRVEYIGFEPRRSDVAVLRVDMSTYPESTRGHLKSWPLAHFNPTEGEECVVMGYAEMPMGDPILTTPDNPDFTWTHKLDFGEGRVEERFPSGRDDLLAPFPFFAVGVSTTLGMSGGPVFTRNGLVGVISRGMDGQEYSLAAYIASAYHLGVDFDLGDGMRMHQINDVISAGGIRATGPRTQLHDRGTRFALVWPVEP